MKKVVLLILVVFSIFSNTSEAVAKSKSRKPAKKEIAIQLFSVRDDIAKDYAGTIEKVGKIGYTGIEAAGYGDGKFYGRSPEEFKSDAQKAGMQVVSSHVNRALNEQELASKDFTEALKWWDQAIDAHARAGARYMVNPGQGTPKTLKELQTYCEYFNEIGKKCKEKGILFGYHNHAHEFQQVEGRVMYDYMIENTDPDYLFFQMDVYWIVRGQQSPVDYFNRYPGRFRLLHVKDNKELGQSGMVGFDAIFSQTATAGVEDIIVEVEHYSVAPLESAKISYDYLIGLPQVKSSYTKRKNK